MTVIEELLDAVKLRPQIFLGQATIDRLSAFIVGWSIASKDAESDQQMEAFQSWVSKLYDQPNIHAWDRLIKLNCIDENKALDRFFELWDEFKMQYGP